MPFIALASRSPNVREAIGLIAAVLTFGTVLSLLPSVMDGAQPAAHVLDVMPGLSLAFQVEPLGMIFALIASGLWIVTTIYAIGYMRGHHEENQTRFFVFFAFAISAALGVAFARNMFTLFIFYEVLTLSTYPLVTHHRSEEALRAGRIYMGILMSTSVGFLLLGMVWTLATDRHVGICAGRYSNRKSERRNCNRPPRSLCLRHWESGVNAIPPLVARSNGRTHASQRIATRRSRGKSRRIYDHESGGLSLWYGPAFGRGPQRMADLSRWLHHSGGVARGDDQGQLESATGVLHNQPIILHRTGRVAGK